MAIDWRSGVEALSFDCYGTLIDWETGIVEAAGPWMRRAGLEDEALLVLFARHETVVQSESPTLAYPRVLAETLRRLGGEAECEPLEPEITSFASSVADWPAFADSEGALGVLGEHYDLAVLSNIDNASLAASVQRLGNPFDLLCTAQTIGSYKPDRRNFEFLLERLDERGISASRLVHVAQSRYHDIEPASELGLRTVWVDRRGSGATHSANGGATPAARTDVKADLVVRSLGELAEMVLEAGVGARRSPT